MKNNDNEPKTRGRQPLFPDGEKATCGPITTSLKTKQMIGKLRVRYEVLEGRKLSDSEIHRRALAKGLKQMIRELKAGSAGTAGADGD